MKRGGPTHPKTGRLARRLELTRYEAVGLLECLFHWAGAYARRGDIGRHDPGDIADGIGWQGDPKELLEALADTGWLDRCSCHGLRIHGWPEHADQAVKKTREVTTQGFLGCYSACGETPEAFSTAGGIDRLGADPRHKTHDPRPTAQDPRQASGGALDRARLTAEWHRLIPEVSRLADLDPTQVAKKVTLYDGKSHVNPANMTPERLAHAVAALHEWHAELTGRAVPSPPKPEPPRPPPRTVGERGLSALEQFAAQRGVNVGSGAGNVVRGGADQDRARLPAGGGPADAQRLRGGDGGPGEAG